MNVNFFENQPFYPNSAIQEESEWECLFLLCDVEKSATQSLLTESILPNVIGPQEGI